MKNLLCAAVALSALALPIAVSAAPAEREHRAPISDRLKDQHQRIQDGVEDHTLSPAEAKRLREREADLRQAREKAWDDGNLSAKERARLERMANRDSRAIYRAKHDGKGK